MTEISVTNDMLNYEVRSTEQGNILINLKSFPDIWFGYKDLQFVDVDNSEDAMLQYEIYYETPAMEELLNQNDTALESFQEATRVLLRDLITAAVHQTDDVTISSVE